MHILVSYCIIIFFDQLVLCQSFRLFNVIESQMEVEIVSDEALKLRYCKLIFNWIDVYGRVLLLLQQLEDILFSCSQKSSN